MFVRRIFVPLGQSLLGCKGEHAIIKQIQRDGLMVKCRDWTAPKKKKEKTHTQEKKKKHDQEPSLTINQ